MSTELSVAFGLVFILLVLILRRIDTVEAIVRDIKQKQNN